MRGCPYGCQVLIAVLLLLLLLGACALRIDDVIPDQGDPYQKVFLIHTWRLP